MAVASSGYAILGNEMTPFHLGPQNPSGILLACIGKFRFVVFILAKLLYIFISFGIQGGTEIDSTPN